jgi:hypothetical protein
LLQVREFNLDLRFLSQRLVPASFEFCDHEPVRRIHRIVLTPGARHSIACLLQRQAFLPNPFVASSLQ